MILLVGKIKAKYTARSFLTRVCKTIRPQKSNHKSFLINSDMLKIWSMYENKY